MPSSLAEIANSGLTQHMHWVLLIAQSVAFILAIAIILRLAHEKRTPSNIFAWALLLLFMPLLGVPLYVLFGGRKIRRLVDEKARMSRQVGIPGPDAIIPGNRITILPDGVYAYRTLCREIDKSQSTIEIATFILGRGPVGQSIVRRLTARAKDGVKVRLLIDALGSVHARDSMFENFRDAGGQVNRFIPLSPFVTRASANLRNHRKIAVFDGVRAMVGGQNMDRRFLSPTDSKTLFADLGLLVEGPAVATLRQVFEGDWAFAARRKNGTTGPMPAVPQQECGTSELKVIPSGPDVEGDTLWENIISLVMDAQENITLVTPYFIPDEVLLRTLVIKAHKGIRVRVIVPEKSNHPIADMARNRYLRQLVGQGVELLFYKRRMLHAKLILVDDRVAVSGSANIDPRSFFVNFEIGLIHTSATDIEAFNSWLAEIILPFCIQYDQSSKSRDSRFRLACENLAHLLTPLI